MRKLQLLAAFMLFAACNDTKEKQATTVDTANYRKYGTYAWSDEEMRMKKIDTVKRCVVIPLEVRRMAVINDSQITIRHGDATDTIKSGCIFDCRGTGRYWYYCHTIFEVDDVRTLTAMKLLKKGDTTNAGGDVVVITSNPHPLK